MLRLNQRIMLATCLLAGAVGGLSPAAYAAAGDIYGGGAAVPAPDFRIKADCYGKPTPLIVKGTPPSFVTLAPFNYVSGKYSQNCATKHIDKKSTAYYISATSGTGILAQFSHDPTKYGFIDAAQTKFFPSVQFGVSETPLSSVDASIWNNGGTETQGSSSVTVVAPGGVVGAGQYPNPLASYGPLVQFPLSVDPLVISYDATYKKVLNTTDNSVTSYHFNIQFGRADGSGGLRLDRRTYCQIFNGQIVNWNNATLKKLNGNVSLEDPSDPTPAAKWSVPLQIVGRGDSAGATLIFTRHLAAACGAVARTKYVDGASTLPATLLGPTYNPQNANFPAVAGETRGKFTLVSGMPGTAQYVAFTATPGGANPNTIIQGRVTYLSPDYALPGVLVSNDNTYNLHTATLKNLAGHWIAPSALTALKAFGSLLPPQTDAGGNFVPGNTANGLRSNPQDWSQPSSKTAALADPVAQSGYPIVGTANWVGYSCYASSAQTATILGILKYGNTGHINVDLKTGILSSIGIAPLPLVWRRAMEATFVDNTSGAGLNINTVGQPGACAASGLTGG